MRAGIVVNVTRADRRRLEAIVADRCAPQKHVWRAQIILATADGCGTAEIIRRSGKAIHIPDILADRDYTWHESQQIGGFRTSLSVPLLREGSVIGVMALTRGAIVQPLTDRQIELVSTFADQAVIAIENVRLFDE